MAQGYPGNRQRGQPMNQQWRPQPQQQGPYAPMGYQMPPQPVNMRPTMPMNPMMPPPQMNIKRTTSIGNRPTGQGADVTIQRDHKFIEKPKIVLIKRDYDFLANFYAIVVAADTLESAWSEGAIVNEDYEKAITQLIAQYKNLKTRVVQHYTSKGQELGAFFRSYCPSATTGQRRLEKGMPATIEFKANQGDGRKMAADIARATQSFITLMDMMELNQSDVLSIQPELQNLVTLLNKIKTLPDTDRARTNVMKWFDEIQKKSASDSLSDDEVKQAQLDIQSAYDSFVAFLET